MEILGAYDLTGTLRGAAALAGCDHKTVARVVAAREAAGGGLPVRARSRPVADPFAEKIDELVDRSRAHVRADKAHAIQVAMGYEGSHRTTRRAVAETKRRWRQKHGRRTRPWIPQPGLWLQWDYGDGPVVAGRRAGLFCAWLAWSRFRVVVPLLDKTLPSVVTGLDRTLRLVGGVPTYALTDNERTVTVEHVCGIAVRNATIVEVSPHYGLTIQTEPDGPAEQGRQRGDGQDRESRSGADRSQPPRGVRGLAGAGAGVRRVHGRCEHAPAHHRGPRQLPTRASDRRERSQAPGLTHDHNPAGGEKRWPPAGRNDGHQPGSQWPPVGRNRWPLTQGADCCIRREGAHRAARRRVAGFGWQRSLDRTSASTSAPAPSLRSLRRRSAARSAAPPAIPLQRLR